VPTVRPSRAKALQDVTLAWPVRSFRCVGALIEQGHPVLFTSTSALVQRLLAGKRDLRLPQEMAKLDRFECLILDDIGYVQGPHWRPSTVSYITALCLT
jgi:IstB-like ATP binding protein